jgi:hypothetical protein
MEVQHKILAMEAGPPESVTPMAYGNSDLNALIEEHKNIIYINADSPAVIINNEPLKTIDKILKSKLELNSIESPVLDAQQEPIALKTFDLDKVINHLDTKQNKAHNRVGYLRRICNNVLNKGKQDVGNLHVYLNQTPEEIPTPNDMLARFERDNNPPPIPENEQGNLLIVQDNTIHKTRETFNLLQDHNQFDLLRDQTLESTFSEWEISDAVYEVYRNYVMGFYEFALGDIKMTYYNYESNSESIRMFTMESYAICCNMIKEKMEKKTLAQEFIVDKLKAKFSPFDIYNYLENYTETLKIPKTQKKKQVVKHVEFVDTRETQTNPSENNAATIEEEPTTPFKFPNRKKINDFVKNKPFIKAVESLTYFLKIKYFFSKRDILLVNNMIRDARQYLTNHKHSLDNESDYYQMTQAVMAAFIVDDQELKFRAIIKNRDNYDSWQHVNDTIAGNLGKTSFLKPLDGKILQREWNPLKRFGLVQNTTPKTSTVVA